MVAQELYRPGIQSALTGLSDAMTDQLGPLREELRQLRQRHDDMMGSGPIPLGKLQDRVRLVQLHAHDKMQIV